MGECECCVLYPKGCGVVGVVGLLEELVEAGCVGGWYGVYGDVCCGGVDGA